MQFRNFFFLLAFPLLLLGGLSVQAQQITTNENGERIIVYPDGTWKYVDESEGQAPAEATESATQNKKMRSMPSQPQISVAERRAIEEAERATAAETNARLQYEMAKSEREEVEEELEEAETYGDLTKAEVADIKRRLKAAKKAEKIAQSDWKKSKKAAKKADAALADSEEATAKKKKSKKTKKPSKKKKQKGEIVNNNPEKQRSKKKKAESTKSIYSPTGDKKFASFSATDDVMKNPPGPDCELSFDGVDEFSGKKRRDVASQLFFSYTNDELRPYYKERDFITCEAYVSSLTGGYKFLTLSITIASETAQRDYGIIEKGSIIHIKLLNGKTVKLFNNKTDIGKIDPLDKSTSYVAQYIISSGDEKQLKRSEVDKVRMIWSSGYEDYEVYELDFFINQLKCLNSK